MSQDHGGVAQIGVDEVCTVLERFGFRRLRVPYYIGSVEFDFGTPMEAGEGHRELILVAAVDHIDPNEMAWNVQNIARALDVAGSSRSITLVLTGDIGLNETATQRLHSVARVLRVADSPSIEHDLAPLLPLSLGLSAVTDAEAPLGQIEKYAQRGRDAPQLRNLIAKSRIDAAHVENDLMAWIERAFKVTESHER